MPDYQTLRNSTRFTWQVFTSFYSLMGVVDIPVRDIYLNPEAMITLYKDGPEKLRALFGEDIEMPALSTPAVSYGHINCLGVELVFPDGGEVNYQRSSLGLEKWIEVLKADVDFASSGMLPFYLNYRQKLSKAFDGAKCDLWFKHEGPMTTAYTLRGENVFLDVYDNPELFGEFLDLLVGSIVSFVHFRNRLDGLEAVNPESAMLCDDVASMFTPDAWEKFVLAAIEAYYKGITTGSRKAHIEDLREEQLSYLERLQLTAFDPSISNKINPEMLRECTRVPFYWRLGGFHYDSMDIQDVTDFVFKATADGASHIFTVVEETMCNPETAKKVQAFRLACKQVDNLLESGISRRDLYANVSAKGMKKFWKEWPDNKKSLLELEK